MHTWGFTASERTTTCSVCTCSKEITIKRTILLFIPRKIISIISKENLKRFAQFIRWYFIQVEQQTRRGPVHNLVNNFTVNSRVATKKTTGNLTSLLSLKILTHTSWTNYVYILGTLYVWGNTMQLHIEP